MNSFLEIYDLFEKVLFSIRLYASSIRENHQEFKRISIMFHHNKVGPCVYLARGQKYIASKDYHLFQFLKNSLTDKNFDSSEDCENHLDRFKRRMIKVLGQLNLEIA